MALKLLKRWLICWVTNVSAAKSCSRRPTSLISRNRSSGVANSDLQHQVQQKIRADLNREIAQITRRIPDVKEVVCELDLPYYA